MENGLHITGQADDQVVDLVIADPKGRVLGLYRGANGKIAITAAEARFLLEALPAMVTRAEYLNHMGLLPPMDPAEEKGVARPDNEVDSVPARDHQAPQGREPARLARVAATNAAQCEGAGGVNTARPEPKPLPQSRRGGGRYHQFGRARAGQAWHASEDTALISSYRAGQGIKDLARIHGRSRKAIELRLARLGVCLSPVARVANAQGTGTCHA